MLTSENIHKRISYTARRYKNSTRRARLETRRHRKDSRSITHVEIKFMQLKSRNAQPSYTKHLSCILILSGSLSVKKECWPINRDGWQSRVDYLIPCKNFQQEFLSKLERASDLYQLDQTLQTSGSRIFPFPMKPSKPNRSWWSNLLRCLKHIVWVYFGQQTTLKCWKAAETNKLMNNSRFKLKTIRE